MRRAWPYLRVWGALLLTFSVCVAPFVVAIFVFGAPWWIAYFILVPQVFAVEWLKSFMWLRGWIT